MSGRTLAFILASLGYWALAIMFLGGMAMGDCFGNEACMAAGDHSLRTGLGVAVGIYIAVLALFFFRRPGRR